MKITREQIVDMKDITGHLVLHCLSQDQNVLHAVAENGEADVQLLINGEEFDINDFVKHWQSQIDEIIKKKAQELIQHEINDIRGIVDALENACGEKGLLPSYWGKN